MKKFKIVDLMVLVGFAKSKTEAKNLIKQGAVTIYEVKRGSNENRTCKHIQ